MLAGPNRRDGSMVCLLVSQKTTLVAIHIVERRVDTTDWAKDELNRLETPYRVLRFGARSHRGAEMLLGM